MKQMMNKNIHAKFACKRLNWQSNPFSCRTFIKFFIFPDRCLECRLFFLFDYFSILLSHKQPCPESSCFSIKRNTGSICMKDVFDVLKILFNILTFTCWRYESECSLHVNVYNSKDKYVRFIKICVVYNILFLINFKV